MLFSVFPVLVFYQLAPHSVSLCKGTYWKWENLQKGKADYSSNA